MANVAPAITPRAKDPHKMARFVTAIKTALETFDDEIGLLQQMTGLKHTRTWSVPTGQP